MKILVIGTAGFIGYHLAKKLLEKGDAVIGLDNIYDFGYKPNILLEVRIESFVKWVKKFYGKAN